MRNKPQQLSSYAKKLLREQDNQIQSLSTTINELNTHIIWINDGANKLKKELQKLKSMNLFQLILWWWKK